MTKKPLSIDDLEKIIKDLEDSEGVLMGEVNLSDFISLLSSGAEESAEFSEEEIQRLQELSDRINKLMSEAEGEILEIKQKIEQRKQSTNAHSSYIKAANLNNNDSKKQ